MHEITQILDALAHGDPQAAGQLLLLIYDELRRLAARKLAQEMPDQTLCATDLVHEVYLRLVGGEAHGWEGRAHFFAAAAEAMRRILVEQARRKHSKKHGGELIRVALPDEIADPQPRREDLLVLNEALDRLERHDSQAAALVKLRYFAGLSHQEAAESLGISRGVADRLWALARAWLHRELAK